jgi:hypothetical protein
MLFDIEDYRTTQRAIQDYYNSLGEQLGYFPTITAVMEHGLRPGGDGEDDASTARATRDAFVKAMGELYWLSRQGIGNSEQLRTLNNLLFDAYEAFADWGAPYYNFWCAYVSFNSYHLNLNEGDVLPWDDSRVFKTMTQEIYDDYYNGMKFFMSKAKALYEFIATIS